LLAADALAELKSALIEASGEERFFPTINATVKDHLTNHKVEWPEPKDRHP
jgi:hypothetical protein